MLTLTVLRCPVSVAPESLRLEGGETVVGRAQDCGWTLPDPERQVSKHHCVVAYRAGGWQVTDISSNGTFLNGEGTPISASAPRRLCQGDRLRLGAYEIEVAITTEQAPSLAQPPHDRFIDDPSGSQPPWQPDDGLFPIEGQPASPSDIGFPARYNPFDPDFADNPVGGTTQSDHTPAITDACVPSRPARSLLPDDWNSDEGSPGVDQPEPNRAIRPPAPPILPLATADAGDLMAAFLRGAGLPEVRPANPAATMEALGQAFRAFVAGLRGAMIARAAVKGEFRIEQTMVRVRGNNPLKFAAGDDDALAALLGVGRHVDMMPAQAVAEALRDVRLHELATVAAMRAAVHALVTRLDPAALRQSTDAAGGLTLMPAQRKARAWEAYEALHASTARGLQDDFDAVFGVTFAHAYERALQDAARREERE